MSNVSETFLTFSSYKVLFETTRRENRLFSPALKSSIRGVVNKDM